MGPCSSATSVTGAAVEGLLEVQNLRASFPGVAAGVVLPDLPVEGSFSAFSMPSAPPSIRNRCEGNRASRCARASRRTRHLDGVDVGVGRLVACGA